MMIRYVVKGTPRRIDERKLMTHEKWMTQKISRDEGRKAEQWEFIEFTTYKWRRNLEFREIEFAKRLMKAKIVAELEKAVEFDDQIEVAEMIAEFTLPVEKSRFVP